jgi:hypothetical protein
MTREDIIRMAREERWGISTGRWLIPTEALERIVNQAVEAERAAEREACAEIAAAWDADHPETNYGLCIGNAIRERGSK